MRLDERAAALIALVEADRTARACAVLEPAAAQARELLRHARRAARLRVATAIGEERTAYAARVGAAEARLATARRMAEQRRLKALVAEGWTRLAPAMRVRWDDAEGRRVWVDAALALAVRLLPAGAWRIDGPSAWPQEERARIGAALAARGLEAAVTADEGIDAGLRIRSRNVELDATLAGLVADRFAIEGRLLHWHLQAPHTPGPGTGQVPGPGTGQVPVLRDRSR